MIKTSKSASGISFIIRNLGAISEAKVELNNLTTIIGANSSSKTYITYLIFGFLEYIGEVFSTYNNDKFSKLSLITDIINSLEEQQMLGMAISLDLANIDNNLQNVISLITQQYIEKKASKILGIQLAENFEFEVIVQELAKIQDVELLFYYKNYVSIQKPKGSSVLTGIMNMEEVVKEYQSPDIKTRLYNALNNGIVDNIFGTLFQEMFPKPFIITSERTGISVFIEELRSLAINEDNNLSPLNNIEFTNTKAPSRVKIEYQEPIINNIIEISKVNSKLNNSFLKDENFSNIYHFIDKEINRGSYSIKNSNDILFKVMNGNLIPLSSTSSSIKSLFLLDIYIKHLARENDLLLIDEPELNLHPTNQRKVARLLAMLVNAGVKIFFTTHSDYLMNEVNNLLLYKLLDKYIQGSISKEYNLDVNMALSANQISAYYMDENKENSYYVLKSCPRENDTIIYESFDNEIDNLTNLFDELREKL